MKTLPGNGVGDVTGDARPSAEDALVFVSTDVAQPPSAAVTRATATISVLVIAYLLSVRSRDTRSHTATRSLDGRWSHVVSLAPPGLLISRLVRPRVLLGRQTHYRERLA